MFSNAMKKVCIDAGSGRKGVCNLEADDEDTDNTGETERDEEARERLVEDGMSVGDSEDDVVCEEGTNGTEDEGDKVRDRTWVAGNEPAWAAEEEPTWAAEKPTWAAGVCTRAEGSSDKRERDGTGRWPKP